jgi:hypothetical protein
MMAIVDGGNELGWVRLELDILASSRTLAPLSEADEARFEELARRERELLGVGRSSHPSTGP